MWLLLGLAGAVRFVLTSQTNDAKVMYWRVPSGPWEADELANLGVDAKKAQQGPVDLGCTGLQNPVGLAVDAARRGLYVADPTTLKITRWVLADTMGKLDIAPSPAGQVVVSNFAARWLAVDSIGNLFFTDEEQSVVYKVPATQLIATPTGALRAGVGMYKADLTNPIKIYEGGSVSAPGGLAVDNFRVFWANKVLGTQLGSVVQGYERPPQANPTSTKALALNTIRVESVCLAGSNVYYTDEQRFLYGVKTFGGAIATISEKMVTPRGCSWDGDGTVFVADEAGNKVYSFPGNMKSLAPQKLTEAFPIQGPVGVAVFSSFAVVASAVALWL